MQLLPLSHHHTPCLNSSLCVHLLTSNAAAKRDLKLAAGLHAATLKTGIHSNLFVANSLLDIYAKCGQLSYAVKLFDQMPDRDVFSWTSLISAHSRSGAADVAVSLFSSMLSEESAPLPNEFTVSALLQACGLGQVGRMGEMVHGYLIKSGFFEDPFLCNSLIDMYSKSGLVGSAEKLLDRLPVRDVVSWSALISGCVLQGLMEKALGVFVEMLEDGITPNLVTLLSIIQACSLLCESRIFGVVHAWVIKLGLYTEAAVANSLIQMYCKNCFLEEGIKVFLLLYCLNGYCCSDPEVVVSIVQAFTFSASLEQSRGIHGYLVKTGFFPCTLVENSLMDMYAKLKQVDLAHRIFEKMENHDIVSWNTMLSCLVKSEHASIALEYLAELHCQCEDELVPDCITLLSSIHACCEIRSLQQGQILHCYVVKSGFGSDVFILNALIDMYAKSGRIDFAKDVFKQMDVKDLGSWNSMMAAYGIHGDGMSALRLFYKLKQLGKQKPNAITFSSVISACSHSGLTMEGYKCFESMQRDYGLEPTMEHYASMVDLLGRSGKLNDAEDFIKKMPISPSSAVWGSLMGSCGLYGNVAIAERAAKQLAILEPGSNIWRVTLSNIYASVGRWEDAAMVRTDMKRKRLRKEVGWSAVEVGEHIFRFMAGDTRHPESKKIYEVYNGLMKQIADVEAY